jgi:hypothetical protein
MTEIIEFPTRHTAASPEDWLRHVVRDALISILQAKDLGSARQMAADALAVLEGTP